MTNRTEWRTTESTATAAHLQGVPLAIEPGISWIILTPMKILQRNLNRSTFVVWEMWRHHIVLLFKFRCNIFIGVRIIKEMPGSVASGTLCIELWQKHIYKVNSALAWQHNIKRTINYNVFITICNTFIPAPFNSCSTLIKQVRPIFWLRFVQKTDFQLLKISFNDNYHYDYHYY